MSNPVNNEPPVLGRRTNKGARRVVRVTGAQDSKVTEVEHVAPPVVEPVVQAAPEPVQQAPAEQYHHSERIQKLAKEIFVDEGIELVEEETAKPERIELPEAKPQSERPRHKATMRLEDLAIAGREEQKEPVSRAAHEQDADEEDTPRSRSRRARAAVSQMLEFSSPETPRETPDFSEQLSAPRSNPMMSLLFQAPVLPDALQKPARANSRTSEASEGEEQNEDASTRRGHRRERTNSRTRTARNARGHSSEDMLESISQALDETERHRGTHTVQASEDAQDTQNADEELTTRRRNRRSTRSERGERAEHSERSAHTERAERPQDEFAEESRSRRSRRLNAQERRAAAEVELIESDLEYDEIDYEPIDTSAEYAEYSEYEEFETNSDAQDAGSQDSQSSRENARSKAREGSEADENEDSERTRRRSRRSRTSFMQDDDDEELTTRRRRRRRSARSDDEANSNSNDGNDGNDASGVHAGGGHSASRVQGEDGEDAETSSSEHTRRRSRSGRRSRGAGTDSLAVETPLRSRKQQYIDEITDIEGSTRLEAKRQRRRDNRRDRNRQAALITEQDFLARREVVNRIMVVRERGNHTQVSVIEDDVLVEHYISDIEEVSAVGNIYQGRVQNVLPSMEAAFVDIGQARNGVLYAGEVNWDTTRLDGQPRRMEHAFKSGDPVLVQVTKDPIGHKGARLTSQVTLAGRFLVLVPSGGMTGVSRKLPERERARLKSIVSKVAPEGMGVIIRTAAEGASEEAIVRDLENLKHQWDHVNEQLQRYKFSRKPHLLQGEPDVVIRVIRDIFNDDFAKLVVEGDGVYERIHEYIETSVPDLLDRVEKWDPEEHRGKDVFDRWQIDSQLRKGMERQVYLPSGGSLVIDRTEAMTTIDVNTGRFIGKGKSLEETVTRCNLEAAEEVVRQLRLRDIGGMVMIDFVDMVMPANRDLVLRRLVECLSRDRTKHQVAEVTSLGLVQMTRKRVGQGLVEAFSEECPTCGGRGFILHDEPTVSAQYSDPYAIKGGDPFVKTNKHGNSTDPRDTHEVRGGRDEEMSSSSPASSSPVSSSPVSVGTTEAVKNSMAAIAAAGKSVEAVQDHEDTVETLPVQTLPVETELAATESAATEPAAIEPAASEEAAEDALHDAEGPAQEVD
ncbi:Rne/Rng family ribonuclease [Alloscardovia macacae]|uniref:Ribonuclease E n=1 Tax=Alloscardovia macacae TaxID=1160091 RepID=A0A261F671_9BIFI|nr:Ribonuclease E/G family [Alloscardovia macacae]